MSILNQPLTVTIIGNNNNVGESNSIQSNTINQCKNCNRIQQLRQKLHSLESLIQIKDTIIEELLNE